jgi:hypothetical protein
VDIGLAEGFEVDKYVVYEDKVAVGIKIGSEAGTSDGIDDGSNEIGTSIGSTEDDTKVGIGLGNCEATLVGFKVLIVETCEGINVGCKVGDVVILPIESRKTVQSPEQPELNCLDVNFNA